MDRMFSYEKKKTATTIKRLRECLARFGLPHELTSDNGTQFISAEFQTYLKINGIKHLVGAPFHPSSNGAAESAVTIMKNCLKMGRHDNNDDLYLILNRFLFGYRNTVHTVTGECPAKLFLNRKLRNKFDMLLPCTKDVVQGSQLKQ